MDPLTNLTLVAAATLFGLLGEGVSCLETRQPDKALAALDKAIAQNAGTNELRALALFYRAQAHQARGNTNAAMGDLLAVIRERPDVPLRQQAQALFLAAGGTAAELLPRESPAQVWSAYLEAVTKSDAEGALKLSRGQFAEIAENYCLNNNGSSYAQAMAQHQVIEERVDLNPTNGVEKATLVLVNPQNTSYTMELVFERDNDRWLLSGSRSRHLAAGGGRNPRQVAGGGLDASDPRNNVLKMVELSRLLRSYATDHQNAFPETLAALRKSYADSDAALCWIVAEPRQSLPYLYCPGLTPASRAELILLAAPVPTGGKRTVLAVGGRVSTIPEQEFSALATTQKWLVAGINTVAEQPAEIKAKVGKLVETLRTGDARGRREAAATLKELGPPAYPSLQPYTRDADPEVREAVRRLLRPE